MVLRLNKEDAISILQAHDKGFTELVSLTKWMSTSPSDETYTATYTTKASSSSTDQGSSASVLITLASKNSLDVQSTLSALISAHTSIPLPSLLKRDDSNSLIASPYTLHAYPGGIPLSSLSSSHNPDDPPDKDKDKDKDERIKLRAIADLHLGSHLSTLHQNVQNDWFGPSSPTPFSDSTSPLNQTNNEDYNWKECYSWQEAFTFLLESALSDLEDRGNEALGDIPIRDLRKWLGRAIGFYLFDDVEVPSLVFCSTPSFSLTHSPSSATSPATSTPSSYAPPTPSYTSHTFIQPNPNLNTVTLHLPPPSPTSLLWADPLLEGAFHAPTPAFLEGYGGSPIVFERQKTKRMWYSVYVALREVVDAYDARKRTDGSAGREDSEGEENENEMEGEKKREEEARKVIRELAKRLEDAPCY